MGNQHREERPIGAWHQNAVSCQAPIAKSDGEPLRSCCTRAWRQNNVFAWLCMRIFSSEPTCAWHQSLLLCQAQKPQMMSAVQLSQDIACGNFAGRARHRGRGVSDATSFRYREAMEITNSFTVDEPIERAWELLTDIPFIAPCLPGAKLTDELDGVYSGGIKIKVGPVTAEYKGSAEFVEKDATNYKAVINGKGRDTRGAGNAQALITAQMVPVGSTTQVDIVTDLKVSGKVAQFGRGVMQDVSTKLLGQFAECLETKIAETGGGAPTDAVAASAAAASGVAAASTLNGGAAAGPTPSPAPAHAASPVDRAAPGSTSVSSIGSPPAAHKDDDVLDLGDIGIGSALAKRAAPAIGGIAVLSALLWLIRRLRLGSRE